MTLPYVALAFSFVAERNGSSLLSMFSNQLLDQHKLLLFFFHLDSVLTLYKVLKKNRHVKNNVCEKTATPSYNPTS